MRFGSKALGSFMSNSPRPLCIAIVGRQKDTGNYERFLKDNGLISLTTLSPDSATACDGLLLPGGGDIDPALFGEKNHGSRNIDTELDLLQLKALDIFIQQKKPVIGICKGMQLINIAFGGNVLQDMPRRCLHRSLAGDIYHPVYTEKASVLSALYGEDLPEHICVNSAHHQCVCQPGQGLKIIQRCSLDNCPEAIVHVDLPILGLQWHPERLLDARTPLAGAPLLSFFQMQHC